MHLDGFPETRIHYALVQDLTLAPLSFQGVLCMLDASYIIDVFQLQVAVHMALSNQRRNAMKTAELDKEILYCLSPSKHVNYFYVVKEIKIL
jgi:hypothetical protein